MGGTMVAAGANGPAGALAEERTFTVSELIQATPDVRIVRLVPADGRPFDFQAGQYARVGFAGLPARDFSIASRPGEPHLEFHIRDAGQGTGAAHYAVRHLRPGERVVLSGPLGDATLKPEHRGPILAIAGGSGLAPVKSIVETALERGHAGPLHLYFGVRTARDLYLDGHFAALGQRHPNLSFVPVLSEPAGPGPWRTGHVGPAAVADFADLSGFKAYLAGPPAMVEGTVPLLLEKGIAAVDIHADAFYTGNRTPQRTGR
ncbi:hypothetical protein [Rhodospirillum centenum]|uniref:hypothetical protein n=1 Tax=Rhodospirillum centenum TaxID=34018 RepID=UPI0002EDEE7A|nr:hypothetical protein [Rhodospirillum centenum]